MSEDEFALHQYYRALRPHQRAALREALFRTMEAIRQAEKHWPGDSGYSAALR